MGNTYVYMYPLFHVFIVQICSHIHLPTWKTDRTGCPVKLTISQNALNEKDKDKFPEQSPRELNTRTHAPMKMTLKPDIQLMTLE